MLYANYLNFIKKKFYLYTEPKYSEIETVELEFGSINNDTTDALFLLCLGKQIAVTGRGPGTGKRFTPTNWDGIVSDFNLLSLAYYIQKTNLKKHFYLKTGQQLQDRLKFLKNKHKGVFKANI